MATCSMDKQAVWICNSYEYGFKFPALPDKEGNEVILLVFISTEGPLLPGLRDALFEQAYTEKGLVTPFLECLAFPMTTHMLRV